MSDEQKEGVRVASSALLGETHPRRRGDAWLCEAWDEADVPCATMAPDRATVQRFVVTQWLGDETDEQLLAIMAEFDERHWEDGPLLWEFEIGSVRVTDVYEAMRPNTAVSRPAAKEQSDE